MTHKLRKQANETYIKFHLPRALKAELLALADARTLSLSALLRLMVTEYIKNKG